jgi:hypothetical protein
MHMSNEEMHRAREAIAKAFREAGRQEIADACGCSRPATYGWDICPAAHVLTVEAMTGISRSFLRPDYYPGKRIEGVEK